jgi:hypothetical protein
MPDKKTSQYADVTLPFFGDEFAHVVQPTNPGEKDRKMHMGAVAQLDVLPFAYPMFVVGDTSAVVVANGIAAYRMPRNFTLTKAKAEIRSAGATLTTIDVKKNGTTIFGVNKLTVDSTETTSNTAATPASLVPTTVLDDDLFTIDVTGVGAGALGLKVVLIGTVP